MPTQQVPLMTPVKGVVRAINREGQPPESCWDAQNVLPYDRYGRKRLAQRGGLKKQFTQQMGNGDQFVQGMLEAPNIIYPPGVFSVPIFTIADLPTPFPLSAPGTVGPFLYDGPIVDFDLEWDWAFNIVYTLAVAPTDPSMPWGNTTETTNTYIFFPTQSLGGAAVNNPSLIIGVGSGGNLAGVGFGTPNQEIAVKFYSGIPSAGIGSWVNGPTSSISTHPSADAQSATQTAPCLLTINSSGFCTMKLGTNATITFSTSTSEFPTLNVYQVIIDPFFGGTNVTSATQTISITD